MAHTTRGGECRQEGCERCYYRLHRKLNNVLLRHTSSIFVAFVVVTSAVVITTTRAIVRVDVDVIVIVFDDTIVTGGYALHFVTVAVVAGDLDGSVCQLVLQVNIGREDDAATANRGEFCENGPLITGRG